ncbi:unnamed protein product [Cochlearia groenlandica]
MASTPVPKDATAVSDLKLGRSDQFIVCRLLRYWDSKNVKKQGEFMGITVLLLDQKDSVIHGFITAARSHHYRPYLKLGSIVRVSRFEVARCANTYKLTDHPFLIRFIPQTAVEEVTVDCPSIGSEKFMLRNFDSLKGLANTNLELPDVVGQINSVQGSDLTQPGVSTRIVIRFLIEPQVVVYLSLWDDAASVFRGLLQKGERTQSIMVVTTVNPKLFGGNLYLNSTPATKFYFHPEMEVVSSFASSVGESFAAGFTCTDTKEGIKKKEVVTIGELNKFITDSNEQTQEADFICRARVVEVLQQNGWHFVSCTGCSKKLEMIGNSLTCTRCANPNMTGIIKYRVELCVDDGADNATFVVFDREMVKITKQNAADLSLHTAGDNEALPACVKRLAGQEFVFHIRVTPFNFSSRHRSFTVSAITDSVPPETFHTQIPEVNDRAGNNPSSSFHGPTVQDENLPPHVSASKSARKRPRE